MTLPTQVTIMVLQSCASTANQSSDKGLHSANDFFSEVTGGLVFSIPSLSYSVKALKAKKWQNHGAFLKKNGENRGKVTTFCSFTYNLQIHY